MGQKLWRNERRFALKIKIDDFDTNFDEERSELGKGEKSESCRDAHRFSINSNGPQKWGLDRYFAQKQRKRQNLQNLFKITRSGRFEVKNNVSQRKIAIVKHRRQ